MAHQLLSHCKIACARLSSFLEVLGGPYFIGPNIIGPYFIATYVIGPSYFIGPDIIGPTSLNSFLKVDPTSPCRH